MSEPARLFIPLTKADAAQHMVFGRIDETPDRAGEVFDYQSSKPYFAAWSAAQHQASGGKSYGNVRAMHGKVAAGRLEEIGFDDPARSIELAARIIDPDEWRKVEEGVYTGFSPGGRYVRRWEADGLMRYTAAPSEVSLVDLPCIPSATFTLVKADGAAERRGFQGTRTMLAKEGRRHSAADLERVQHIHDTAVALGAACPEHAPDQDLAPEKLAGDGTLAKIAREIGRLREDHARLARERDGMARRLAELEALPRPGGPVLRAVAKGDDIGGAAAEDELAKLRALPDGPAKSLALIKLAHRRPLVVGY